MCVCVHVCSKSKRTHSMTVKCEFRNLSFINYIVSNSLGIGKFLHLFTSAETFFLSILKYKDELDKC